MILFGTGFHKGIPEYSKHNSPSSIFKTSHTQLQSDGLKKEVGLQAPKGSS